MMSTPNTYISTKSPKLKYLLETSVHSVLWNKNHMEQWQLSKTKGKSREDRK